jgi:hypothetical protein
MGKAGQVTGTLAALAIEINDVEVMVTFLT